MSLGSVKFNRPDPFDSSAKRLWCGKQRESEPCLGLACFTVANIEQGYYMCNYIIQQFTAGYIELYSRFRSCALSIQEPIIGLSIAQ